MSRKSNSEKVVLDMSMALLKLEDWLGYRPSSVRPFRIYDSFDGTQDLIFKDSTIGLVTIESTIPSVIAYKELFSHVESCNGAGSSVIISAVAVVFTVSIALFVQ